MAMEKGCERSENKEFLFKKNTTEYKFLLSLVVQYILELRFLHNIHVMLLTDAPMML